MTLKEALKIKTNKLNLSEGEIDLALIEGNLDASTVYNPVTNGKELDMVYVGLLLTVIQVTEVKEDDVSIKYASNLKSIASAIYIKWGLIDPFEIVIPKPTVRYVNI